MELPQVIVALDLGKYKHTALVYNTQQHTVGERLTFSVNQQGFAALGACLERHGTPANSLIGCEATGYCGETVLRYLQVRGYSIVRLNPAQVVQFRRGLGRRAKTDELDADAIARQLTVGTRRHRTHVDPTSKALQRLTRLRLDFVDEQTRWVSRLRGILNQTFPELEVLLKNLLCPSSLALLSTYPSRQSIAAAAKPAGCRATQYQPRCPGSDFCGQASNPRSELGRFGRPLVGHRAAPGGVPSDEPRRNDCAARGRNQALIEQLVKRTSSCAQAGSALTLSRFPDP